MSRGSSDGLSRSTKTSRPLSSGHDEFEVAFDQGEIGSRLIGVSQREHVLV
jgi:hypothetical protein